MNITQNQKKNLHLTSFVSKTKNTKKNLMIFLTW